MKAIEYKGQKVITTEMLAQAYGTNSQYITKNYHRNKSKFQEGKHYFCLIEEELRNFKREMSKRLIAENVNKLYLWTERGANHHCKILDTDEAWEQFENLEETYFRVKNNIQLITSAETIKYLNGVANYLRIQRAIMKDKGCTPYEIALMDKMVCENYGIPIPECITKPSTYEQLVLEGCNNALIE